MMLVVAIKEIYLCVAFARGREDEQINVRITDGGEKKKRERGRRIFHANQINDNLCMYAYIYECECLSHHVFVYISKAHSRI